MVHCFRAQSRPPPPPPPPKCIAAHIDHPKAEAPPGGGRCTRVIVVEIIIGDELTSVSFTCGGKKCKMRALKRPLVVGV